MLTRLFWQPWRPARPQPVYYLLCGGTSFLLVLAFTLSQVYYVTVVGLGRCRWSSSGPFSKPPASCSRSRQGSSRTSTAGGSRSSSV